MSIRTVCVILAVTLWSVERPLAWAALVAGGVLPYIAVVIANAGRENAKDRPGAMITPTPPPELESHPHQVEERDPDQHREYDAR
jgi:hypothetical protein